MRVVAAADFDDWYAAQRPRVYLSMPALSGDVDLAADATDEAFTRAVAQWKRVSAMESPGGWTQRVALNVLRRRLRRGRTERHLLRTAVGPSHVAPPTAWGSGS